MKIKICLFFCIIVSATNISWSQIISKKTRKFAQQYLWKNGDFYDKKIWKDIKSTDRSYSIELIGDKKFSFGHMKIYFFGVYTSESETYVLLEKSHKNGISDYAVIGPKPGIDPAETMCLFFIKYRFPEHVENECCSILLDSYVFRNLEQDMSKVDSFFNEHR